MSHIIKLSIDNVKRLKAVDITPNGDGLVVIGGKNDQGKSSVLDSILYVLGGAKVLPEMPVRAGEERAKIVADLGDLVITRTITPVGGGSLTVKSKDGAVYQSPQAMLDRLTGKLTFDPLAFTLMKPAEQVDALKRMLGLDFTEHDAEYQRIYSERTVENRKLTEAAALLNSMPVHPDVPQEVVSVTAIADELDAAIRTNQAAEDLVQKAKEASDAIYDAQMEADRCEKHAFDIEDRIAQLQKELQLCREAHLKKVKEVVRAKQVAQAAEKAAAEAPTIDLAPIRERMGTSEQINEKVRANRAREQQQQKVTELKTAVDEMTKALDHLDAKKQAALEAAPFPVEGLSFGPAGVTYKGVPFAQASTAVKIRVSVAMACAMNPKLKVMLIRDGSLLDDESLALVADLARQHDAQVWIERVGKGAECSVIIEDGAVLAPEEVKAS
jgi:hypothetical protein